MKAYRKLLRMHHYVKNLLLFAPLVCSGQLLNPQKLRNAVIGFFGFCFAASAVYILNDIQDVEKDRLHPTKRNRPIAAGKVSISAAWFLAGVLLAASGGICFLLRNIPAAALLALYIALNLAYSCGLKNIPIVDIAILVSGFLIRVFYGALITEISISNWLYLTVIAISFYFALGKRRNEWKQLGDDTRAVLKGYPLSFLDKGMTMCLTLAIAFYALWSMDAQTVCVYHNGVPVLSVPVVMLITMKYSLNVEGDSDGDPVEVLLHDKGLILLCAGYVAFMCWGLYW